MKCDATWMSAIVAGAAVVFLGCAKAADEGSDNSGMSAAGAAPLAGAAGALAGTTAGTTAGTVAGTAGAVAGTSAGTAGTTAGTTPAGSGGMAGTAMAGAAGAAGAVSGTGGMAGAAGMDAAGTGAPSTSSCGPETTVAAAELNDHTKLGPWTPTHIENTGPDGQSWIFYPENLGEGGMKHPLFQWGPGAGTGPNLYVDHLNLLASQGFVIICQSSTLSGKEALDWMLAENDDAGSMFHQKLDPDRVARGGHSMGALQSFSESDDPRLKLAVLVCGGANGGSGAGNMSYPTLFLGGDGEGGTVNFAGDYAEVTGLSVFVTHGSTDHIYCARDNLGPWVAFMRWQLCGEEEKWKKEFAPGGTFCQGDWLDCMTKNF